MLGRTDENTDGHNRFLLTPWVFLSETTGEVSDADHRKFSGKPREPCGHSHRRPRWAADSREVFRRIHVKGAGLDHVYGIAAQKPVEALHLGRIVGDARMRQQV